MRRSIAPWSPPSIPSIRPRCASSTAAGRHIVGSAPVGLRGHRRRGSRRSARPAASARERDRRGAEPHPAGHQGARSAKSPIRGRITLSGYEGSELLVARLLIESGADVRYVGTACPRTAWSDAGPRMARGQGRARAIPRLARAGSRRHARVRARSRDRHDAGGAGGQGNGHPGAVFHQFDLGAPADGPRRRRLAGAGRQRGARQPRLASTR